jgi:hypothetical protein
VSKPLTFETTVHFRRRARGRKELHPGEGPRSLPPGRVPRVARLLALAHRFEALIAGGHVKDYAELARLGHVTRARITQVMNLLLLAPDIQEEVLFLPPTLRGRDPIRLAVLQPIALQPDWKEQRLQWRFFLAESGTKDNQLISVPTVQLGLLLVNSPSILYSAR